MEHSFPVTKLAYFDDMRVLSYSATVVAVVQENGGRRAVVLDATVFHPQGGGQPADTGFIDAGDVKFVVDDVRSKDGVVFHYGKCVDAQVDIDIKIKEGQKVSMQVDAERRKYNSRLHSAGHLLDIGMRRVGLSHLEPGKGYHFPDRPFVEYKGTVSQDQQQIKQEELEKEANALISAGGNVVASVLPYGEAAEWCGGDLPSYVEKESNPRIVRFGNHPGCPCGGTHVANIADIGILKIDQMRSKKGLTKVFYSICP